MTKRQYFGGILLLLVLGGMVYWSGLRGGFIFDDYPNLVADPDWKVESLDWNAWHRAMSFGIASDLGRPLALLTFAMNHYFTGMATFPMKATGLAIHLLNAVLVFVLCLQLFRAAAAPTGRAALGGYAAFLIALAWTVHPLQVSTVLYIVQRMELGAYTGVLLALVAYLQARRAQCRGERCWPWFLLVVAATAFGLGFKESALLVPGYTFVLELFLLRFRGADGQRSKAVAMVYGLGAVAALALYVGLILPRALSPAAYAARDFTVVERIYTQFHVLSMYLRQMIWPMPETLLFYYDHFPVSKSLWSPLGTLFGLAILIGMMVVAWTTRRNLPLVSVGLAWFFVAHALTSNVVPLELAFEHRNYFALFGVLLALAQGLAWLSRSLNQDTRMVLGALPVLLLGVLCVIQVQRWSDPLKQAVVLASGNPESSRASYELGKMMVELAGSDHGSPLLSLALKEFKHAGQLKGSSPLPEQATIVVLSRTGQEVDRETWDRFRDKLSRRAAGPQEYNALYGVTDCRVRRQCVLDDQQLFEAYLAFLQRNPRSAKAHAMYSNLAYNVLGDSDLAIEMAREAIRLAPRSLQYKGNLVRFLDATGKHPAELARLKADVRANDPSYFLREEAESPRQ